jgi:hypothetical protein
MKKAYYLVMKIIITIAMVLSFIEGLHIVTLLMSFILLMFIRPIRVWLLTPDKF